MSKWRIGVLVGHFPSISETFITTHVSALMERGHDVVVLTRSPVRTDIQHESYDREGLQDRIFVLDRSAFSAGRVTQRLRQAWNAVNHVPAGLRASKCGAGAGLSAQIAALARPLRELRHRPLDILHCHFGVHGVFGVQLNRSLSIAQHVITTFHGFDVNTQREQRKAEYAPLFRYGDRYTANTRFTAGRLTTLGCPSERVEIWPMGTPSASFRFKERTLEDASPVRLVTVARLTPKKGIDDGIRALGIVASRTRAAWNYQVVGSGSTAEIAGFMNLANELGIRDRVHFLGPRFDFQVRKILDESHIFLLASRTAPDGDMEGQGVVLQEAQATGLPVVTTYHNGIPEGVADGASALLVPESDPVSLADALQVLIEHPDRWAEMGRAGRDFVEQYYDLRVTTDKLEQIYERTMAERD